MVTIIASVFNCEKYISEMLESIIAQTYADWELIIIDDASTDSTWNIIRSYDDLRIKLFKNDENMGLTKNLNKALTLARGNYIARIDGDDVALPHRLERQVNYMESHPEVGLAGTWMQIVGRQAGILKSTLDSKRLNINLLFDAVMFHPSFMIRKSILDQYNIKYDESLKYAQDYNIEYRISQYADLGNIDDVLMKYRMHDAQVSVQKKEEQLSCANKTRKLILNNLGIDISDEKLLEWAKFCLADVQDPDNCRYIEEIKDKIIVANKQKNIYDKGLLEKILQCKYKMYAEACARNQNERCKKRDKNAELYQFLFMLIHAQQRGLKIDAVLDKMNIKTIAIYGCDNLGKVIFNALVGSEIEIKYGIDRNPQNNYIEEQMEIYTLEDELPLVDAIVVTAITFFEEIRDELSELTDMRVISLEELIQ
ncbi:MAG: glycosyltransferase [Lachnospiraceae bacterium]|nr:glycosyltransferase [Lachnospiraceae bacterium]